MADIFYDNVRISAKSIYPKHHQIQHKSRLFESGQETVLVSKHVIRVSNSKILQYTHYS